MSSSTVSSKLFLRCNEADEHQSKRYYRYSFVVPEGCTLLRITFDTETEKTAQVPLLLYDSEGNVRLMRAANATIGQASLSYAISQTDGDKGCIPGPLPAGVWKLVLFKRRIFEDFQARIRIQFEISEDKPTESGNYVLDNLTFSQACIDPKSGWYCGELHTHSDESTGYTTLDDVIEAAKKKQLDFIAITDHFSASHWLRLQEVFDGERPLLLQSMEVSGDFGHANVHGLTEWCNPFVDDNEKLAEFLELTERPTMEGIADQVHENGGLFCINHALSGIMGWRYREFPLSKADLYEVYCTPENETSMLYTTHWDALLLQGYKLTGVGSSDSHHPTKEGPWEIGNVLTWVHAASLSQKDVLDALKRGHAYIGVNGVKMDFQATSGKKIARMGDTLSLQQTETAQFTLSLFDHPRGYLYIYADGFIMDTIYFDEPGSTEYCFALDHAWIGEKGSSYLRIEFHESKEPPRFHGMIFRNHLSARLISNPIWLKRGD